MSSDESESNLTPESIKKDALGIVDKSTPGECFYLRRRDSIPLHEMHNHRRRDRDIDLNYRRTKDIRHDVDGRRYEQHQDPVAMEMRELNKPRMDDKERLQKLRQDLRWLTINTDEGISIGI